MKRELPSNFLLWPENECDEKPPEEIVRMYDAGYAGCWHDPDARAEFGDFIEDSGFYPKADSAISAFGLADSAAGKLSTPFQIVEQMWPGCWPASAQTRGDCVSHGTRNACLVSMIVRLPAGNLTQ